MALIRVLIADDHAILRSGIRTYLQSTPDVEVVGEAEDGALAVRRAAELRPDVIVLDIAMPGASGLDVLAKIRKVSPNSRVLVLTMHDDHAYLRRALALGASGYMVKTGADTELLSAIRTVHRGQSYIAVSLADSTLQGVLSRRASSRNAGDGPDALLSERERQVLSLVAYGHTYKEIADRLELSVKTVETYRSRVGEKLGLRSRVDLVRYALAHNLLVEATQNEIE